MFWHTLIEVPKAPFIKAIMKCMMYKSVYDET